MTQATIEELLRKGEGFQIEFKESFHQLNKDAFDSVCAFLNGTGGHLLLGVRNDGEVQGVLDPEVLVRELTHSAHNPNKLFPTADLVPAIIDYDGKKLVAVYVPESSQAHHTAHKTFIRKGEADLDISRQSGALAQLYLRKQQGFTENRIFPHLALDQLRSDLIERARRMARVHSQNMEHPWLGMGDDELLRSAKLYREDSATGARGYTLAAALLFGTDQVIGSILPHHRTDAIYRVHNVDRYDDRDIVETNLIESHDRLMAFVGKHLPDKFFQEEDASRVSIRNRIFREVIANTLAHREYAARHYARLVIERGRVVVENASKPRLHGPVYPDTVLPSPKNPVIAKVFREIGIMEELGSGIRNLFRDVPSYTHGRQAELIDDDIFKATIPIDLVGGYDLSGDRYSQVREDRVRYRRPIDPEPLTVAEEEPLHYEEAELEPVRYLLSEANGYWLPVLESVRVPKKWRVLQESVGPAGRDPHFRTVVETMQKLGLIDALYPNSRDRLPVYRIADAGEKVLYLLQQQTTGGNE